MPRRNNTSKPQRYQLSSSNDDLKRSFPSKQTAQRAIKELQKYHLDLSLDVYQSPTTGKWHLTSAPSSTPSSTKRL